MNSQQFMGIVRHVATFVAGVAVSKGYLDDQSALEIVGGLVALAGIVWSWTSKKNPA